MGRIAILFTALTVVLFALSAGTYRVSAPATLEGAVQRAVVAPFDGYIIDAQVRAGQEVAEGRLLARLDDRELVGERRRLHAEQGEYAEEHRQAVATLDHGKAKILESQLEQSGARLSLVQDQLTRTELRAPLGGLIISGDWSRSIGVPVSRGDLLFQIAPLNEYRVTLRVSDRDIAGLATGQQGELTLSALPSQVVRFMVSGISSMASDETSEPAFRVEATLTDKLPGLRPGMQGVAKVDVGERRRWWIWTHTLTDWLRLQLWRMLP
jgi:multidrug efflux pump subunit AcrA (membrane-fusion protein)